jgi:hypothetical protein
MAQRWQENTTFYLVGAGEVIAPADVVLNRLDDPVDIGLVLDPLVVGGNLRDVDLRTAVGGMGCAGGRHLFETRRDRCVEDVDDLTVAKGVHLVWVL